MLDWIFEGIATWVASVMTQIMDAISGVFIGALGTDMTAMEEYFPFAVSAYSIIQYTAWALLFLVVVWQIFRAFSGPLAETENPLTVLARGAIFGILISYAKPIFSLALDIARAPYTALMDSTLDPGDFTFAGIEQALTNGLTTLVSVATVVGLILLIILMIALAWNYFKLLLETVERYVLVGVLCYTSPLAYAMGASKATSRVFQSWCRMVGSQLLLLVLNVWFLRAFNSSVGQFVANGGALTNGQGNIFLWLFCALALLKIAQKCDSYLAALGLSVAQTGSSMGIEMLMAARALTGFTKGGSGSAASVFGGGAKGGAGAAAGAAGGVATGGILSGFITMAQQIRTGNGRRRKAPPGRGRKTERLEFVQDYIPLKEIRNGIVETTDGRYLKILEIEPINFLLRSNEEQWGIISTFASWLKISPMRLQFKSVTRKADSDRYVAGLEADIEKDDVPACRELGEGTIRFIQEEGSREALTRRFFLIFQYEAVRRQADLDYGEVYAALQTMTQNARTYFAQCGNSIVQPKDEDAFVAEILYMYFNRRSCVDDPFQSRLNRVVVDAMTAKKRVVGVDPVPKIRAVNFVAPRGLDLSHPGYIVMDGMYPATYPSQIFFLKEDIGYEIVVLYDGEQHLARLLQPQEDLRYIFVLPHIRMAQELVLPNVPCLFATVDYNGQEVPNVRFYTESEGGGDGTV